MSVFSFISKVTTAFAALFISTSLHGMYGSNFAPFWSEESGSETLPERYRAIGPFFETSFKDDTVVKAARPFYVQSENEKLSTSWKSSLYPLFTRKDHVGGYRWDFFELLIGSKTTSVNETPIYSLELWPLFWHYDNGVAEESYDAVFPIAGTLRNKLFYKRIDWFMFPAFVRLGTQTHVDTYAFWPFLRWRNGENESGMALWPLFGHFEGEGKYSNTFALWPIFYNNYRYLPQSKGGGTRHQFGILPLYARETAPNYKSETFLWPFFGYTLDKTPNRNYREIRYLWPLIVQGRGDIRYVNRLLPIYAHETRPNYEKTWYGWPLLKSEKTNEGNLLIQKQTLLYFLYKNEVQSNDARHFKARKTQLWPLFGYANDGQGERQFMLLNPFEPLISGNEIIRETWTPFFAIYRYEAKNQDKRISVLWDLFLYEEYENGSDFSIGPIFETSHDESGRGWSLLKGFIGQDKDGGWEALWGLFQ